MDKKQKRWKKIAIIALTASAILVGVVIALVNHIAVAAGRSALQEATLVERPQTIKTILEDILYIPADLPAEMEVISLDYSGAEFSPHFVCRYEDTTGSWFEIGISVGDIANGYTHQSDKDINGNHVAIYARPDDATLIAYQVNGINYFVCSGLPFDDLSMIMDGYLDFIINQNLV